MSGGDDFDEEEYRRFMEQSQPSIFEIVLEDLLLLKGQKEKAALSRSMHESYQQLAPNNLSKRAISPQVCFENVAERS